jgi:hypothetical protein
MTIIKTGGTPYTVETPRDALLFAIGVVRKHGRNWPPFCVEQTLLGSIENELQAGVTKLRKEK